MLSRLQPKTVGTNLLRCVGQFRIPVACTSSKSVPSNQSPQRDLINFPRPVRLEKTEETRFGFLPKSWFDFFYPKTGVTGPYMFMFGVGTYMFSKEIIVVGPEFYLAMSFITAVFLIQKEAGPAIKDFVDKRQKESINEIDSEQEMEKKNCKDTIDMCEKSKWQYEGIVSFLPDAKRENVYLQMEAAYRSRLLEASAKVKSYLDYQLEKETIERRIAQKNMVDYVIRNVEKSISSQLKKNALKQCIGDLKNLAARA